MSVKYWVETLRDDGTWQIFTVRLLEEHEANAALVRVQEYAREQGFDPAKARLRPVSDEEMKEHLIEVHPDVFDWYLKSLPLTVIEAAIEAFKQQREIARQEAKRGAQAERSE